MSHSGLRQGGADAWLTQPPWRDGRGGFAMGLRPLAPARWFPEAASAAERARKRDLYIRRRDAVYQHVAGAEAAARTAAEAVNAYARRRGWPLPAQGRRLPPLMQAALQVPDDLCVLQPGVEGPRLVAASLCAPSYWSLAEKMGQPLQRVHAPVATLNEKLGARIAYFLEHLRPGQLFERRNWFVHANAIRFQPAPERFPEDADVGALYLRSERQTLCRVGGVLIFTIGIDHVPLSRLADMPEQARALRRALLVKDPSERSEFGDPVKFQKVLAFLEAF